MHVCASVCVIPGTDLLLRSQQIFFFFFWIGELGFRLFHKAQVLYFPVYKKRTTSRHRLLARSLAFTCAGEEILAVFPSSLFQDFYRFCGANDMLIPAARAVFLWCALRFCLSGSQIVLWLPRPYVSIPPP